MNTIRHTILLAAAVLATLLATAVLAFASGVDYLLRLILLGSEVGGVEKP